MKRAEFDMIAAGLAHDVVITRDSITACMVNQTEKYAHYAIAYNRALRDAKLLKFQLEQCEAGMDQRARGVMKKVTEAVLCGLYRRNEIWQKLMVDLLEAEDCRDSLESILRAMEHRRDMLVNLGATVREELRSADVHVNKEPFERKRSHGTKS